MAANLSFLARGLQSASALLFDTTCIACGETVDGPDSLCGPCWRDTRFIRGLVCDLCGTPLPGEDDGRAEYCDDCLTIARPWARGRAALLYAGTGRSLVLALKHADRPDLAPVLGRWLAAAAAPILGPGSLVLPVPLHRFRLLRRRYNQAAELARVVAWVHGIPCCPDGLRRSRRTPSQDGRDRDQRFANLAGALTVPPARRDRIAGRDVLLVDDVMTSGATFAAAAEACHAAGASSVSVLALARVAKDA
jgi:predicted amidophosphoribosyltransferase